MIKFLRKIRQNLLNEGHTKKYLKYAIGEIALVVIGILLALKVNNWNERQKMDSQFKNSVENLYNSIASDVENFQIGQQEVKNKEELITKVINSPMDAITRGSIQNTYYFTSKEKPYSSETSFYLNNLKADPNNIKQTEILKEITNYVNNLQTNGYNNQDNVYQMMIDEGIPPPKPDINSYQNAAADSSYYGKNDLNRFLHLLDQPKFKAEIVNLQASRFYEYYELNTKISSGRSILALIKNYYPDTKILFKDVGIIGTSINGFDDVGAKSTPMIETDFDRSIWELELHLKKGAVKFRCRDSWAINWGGDTFPDGIGYQDGPDITIPKEGLYHVTLNLTEKTYSFVKLNDKDL